MTHILFESIHSLSFFKNNVRTSPSRLESLGVSHVPIEEVQQHPQIRSFEQKSPRADVLRIMQLTAHDKWIDFAAFFSDQSPILRRNLPFSHCMREMRQIIRLHATFDDSSESFTSIIRN